MSSDLLCLPSPQHLGSPRTADHARKHPLGGIDLRLGGGLARRADLLGSPESSTWPITAGSTFTAPVAPGEDAA